MLGGAGGPGQGCTNGVPRVGGAGAELLVPSRPVPLFSCRDPGKHLGVRCQVGSDVPLCPLHPDPVRESVPCSEHGAVCTSVTCHTLFYGSSNTKPLRKPCSVYKALLTTRTLRCLDCKRKVPLPIIGSQKNKDNAWDPAAEH